MRGKKVAATAKELSSVEFEGATYSIGDTVLINPDAEAPAYIARIRKITHHSSDPADVELDVVWFYRPEEAEGGRKAFHGEAEVFDSDHSDKAPLAAIIGRCNIHSISKYETLKRRTEHDFFVRFRYKSRTKQFEPDRVPVYCKCSLPYNPDKPMVLCATCEEWYHPQCLGLGQEVYKLDAFTCPDCQAQSTRPSKRPSNGAVPG